VELLSRNCELSEGRGPRPETSFRFSTGTMESPSPGFLSIKSRRGPAVRLRDVSRRSFHSIQTITIGRGRSRQILRGSFFSLASKQRTISRGNRAFPPPASRAPRDQRGPPAPESRLQHNRPSISKEHRHTMQWRAGTRPSWPPGCRAHSGSPPPLTQPAGPTTDSKCAVIRLRYPMIPDKVIVEALKTKIKEL